MCDVLCGPQGWLPSCTVPYGMNRPSPPQPPEPDRSQEVQRHAPMSCFCYLIDCCHSEFPEDNYSFRHQNDGVHVDSGSPQSGWLLPWAAGDDSWVSGPDVIFARR